ncbi:MAG: NAD(P)/FAD-dependent oxidoreductase [Archaeoglobaceae archaeon]|nr:NAD(P)/FAD-dependent oxidoreductase [Archaeoglobaceae archaeon]MDW7989204.1 NAD(P)/FAD-dependent oxidoreductase [Archaeoglobaceae archaeon]
MIQIYGAGISGTFLYNYLIKKGYSANIFDFRKSPDCRCGWGIAYREAKELYSLIELNLDEFILVKPEKVVINGIELKNKGIATFDKLRLLSELWKGIEFKEKKADLIVDATGAERAFLPKIKDDRLLPTMQFEERHEKEENIYIYFKRYGYAWAFPLGDCWHIGAGSIEESEIPFLIKKLREKFGFEEKKNICSCKARIRMLPPSKCKPFVHCNVVGVGESIGCVSGAGEGNTPALKCSKILLECIEKLENYEKMVLKEFKWIEMEQKFVESVFKRFPAFHLLFKIIPYERKRLVCHSILDFLRIFYEKV